jgi:hypothetical protein
MPDGDISVKDGATLVSPVLWHVPGPVPEGVPSQQALERLVCMALSKAWPERGKAVEAWVKSRPLPPKGDKLHKAHAWSFMAGWYADQGCDAFYSLLWEDAAVASELEALLRASGGWRVAEALVN